MRGLIVIVHGSRRQETNRELKDFLGQLNLEGFIVQQAYMELQNPNLLQAIEILEKKGCLKIEVFPFFLLAGKHIDKDIPQQYKQAEQKFPHIKMNLMGHFTQLHGVAQNFSSLLEKNLSDL